MRLHKIWSPCVNLCLSLHTFDNGSHALSGRSKVIHRTVQKKGLPANAWYSTSHFLCTSCTICQLDSLCTHADGGTGKVGIYCQFSIEKVTHFWLGASKVDRVKKGTLHRACHLCLWRVGVLAVQQGVVHLQ